jgi:hypothetical protein
MYQETRGLDLPAQEVTIMALLADQMTILDSIETKISGTVNVGVEDTRVMPASVFYRIKDIVVENNKRLARIREQLEVVN